MALSDELEALAKRHGATSYRNRADTQHPAYGFTEDGLNGLIGEVLAKWGTPPAVAGEPIGYCHEIKWRAHQSEQVQKITRKAHPEYGYTQALYTTQQPTQAQVGAVPLDEARRLFDAGWRAAALFCDREDVVADGIIGFGACPQFEAAFSAAHGIKGGQHGTE